jgi:hypothetical protein
MRRPQCVVQYNVLRKMNCVFLSPHKSIEKATTVTSAFFQTFFMRELTRCPQVYDNARLHQEGTSLHTARYSTNALNQLFFSHVIRRNERSSDLSSCERFRAEELPKEQSLL